MTKQSHRIKDAIEQNTVELQARVKTLEAKVEKYRMKHKLGKSKARQLSQVYAQRTAKLKSVAAIDTLEDGHSRGIVNKKSESFPSKRSSISTSSKSSEIGTKEDESLIKEEEDLIREKAFTTMKSLTTPDISQQLQAELRKCEEVEALLIESSSSKRVLKSDPSGDFDVSRKQRRKNKIYGVGLLPQKQDFSTSPDEFFFFWATERQGYFTVCM